VTFVTGATGGICAAGKVTHASCQPMPAAQKILAVGLMKFIAFF
jgi:hypothetical protein